MPVLDDVRSYSIKYPDLPAFWLDLCRKHVGLRLENKASVLDKRAPVTVSRCADCDPKGTLR